MLVQHLRQEFREYFERDPEHDAILWFDPHREWQGLLPFLQPHISLVVFDGSQLHLRYQLVTCRPDERFVVYLPFKRLELSVERSGAEYLRPFLYTPKRMIVPCGADTAQVACSRRKPVAEAARPGVRQAGVRKAVVGWSARGVSRGRARFLVGGIRSPSRVLPS